MKFAAKVLAITVMTGMMTGCASFWSDDNPDPRCSETPDGLGCRSLHEMHEITSGPNYKEKIRIEIEEEKRRAENGYDEDDNVAAEATDSDPESISRKPQHRQRAERRIARSKKSQGETFGMPQEEGFQDGINHRITPTTQYVPTLVQSSEMHIWIAPWQDDSGRLHRPGLISVEVGEPSWEIGEKVSPSNNIIAPLK